MKTAFDSSRIGGLRKSLGFALILFSIGGCKEKLTIRPTYDFETHSINIIFGDKNEAEKLIPLEFLEVVTCKNDSTQGPTNRAVWRIEAGTKPNIVKLSRIAYGETPPGARVVVEAQPLETKCYWLRDSHARYRFQLYGGGMSGSGDLLANDPVFKKRR